MNDLVQKIKERMVSRTFEAGLEIGRRYRVEEAVEFSCRRVEPQVPPGTQG